MKDRERTRCRRLNQKTVTTVAGAVLGKSIGLRAVAVFMLACFAISLAQARQQVAPEVFEY